MVVAAMLLRRSPMSFRSLIVVFGSLLMHIFRHGVSLVIWGRSSVTSEALDSSKVRLKLWGPRLFFSALYHCLHSNVRRPTPWTVHRFDQSDRSLPAAGGASSQYAHLGPIGGNAHLPFRCGTLCVSLRKDKRLMMASPSCLSLGPLTNRVGTILTTFPIKTRPVSRPSSE